MKEFFKLYIGESFENSTLQGVVIKDLLKPKIQLLVKTLQDGQDLFIEDFNHNVSGYKKDHLDKIYG